MYQGTTSVNEVVQGVCMLGTIVIENINEQARHAVTLQ